MRLCNVKTSKTFTKARQVRIFYLISPVLFRIRFQVVVVEQQRGEVRCYLSTISVVPESGKGRQNRHDFTMQRKEYGDGEYSTHAARLVAFALQQSAHTLLSASDFAMDD